MRRLAWLAMNSLIVIAISSPSLGAQDEYGENSRLNTNLAFSLTAPLNPIAKFANFGWGTTVGAGYNFSRRNAFVGEFLWNRLYPSSQTLAPLRLALHSADLHGHSDLYAFTANYRFELRGQSLGTYFIGGAGFYYRNATLSKHVVTGTATECTPVWLFWGFSCSQGVVSEDQTLATSSSAALGFNGGVGFTIKVGEPRYRMYFEARYHYAPTTRINTQVIPVTIGIRF
jgi:outer membrane protein with beta-barrel domain